MARLKKIGTRAAAERKTTITGAATRCGSRGAAPAFHPTDAAQIAFFVRSI
jgi:hypothetical protein